MDIFNINKHIKEWINCHNLYDRITGELTTEAINWYKSRAIVEIWADCILAWNEDHLRSCKSVTMLETCFLERGIHDIRREQFGCMYITMSNLRYMIQVFSESKTTGLVCGAKVEEKILLKMNAKDIVDFVVAFDSFVPKIIEMADHAIFKVQQDRHIDKIAELSLSTILDSLIVNTSLGYEIINIKRGNVKLVIYPVRNYGFHVKTSMPFEQVRDKMGLIILAFETIVKQMNDNPDELEIFSYSYPYTQTQNLKLPNIK